MLYNIIHHNIRNAAGLSLLDYCILETVYLLSTSKRERYTGWCNASKSSFSHLASTRTIATRFSSLEKRGWLEFKGENRYLKKTTSKYYKEVRSIVEGVKKLHTIDEVSSPPHEETSQVKELHPPHEETSPLPMKKCHGPDEED